MNAQSFRGDHEYLDLEAKFHRAKAARLAAEDELAHATGRFEKGEQDRPYNKPAREVRCRVMALKQVEENLLRELHERHDAHRQADCPPLGIDVVSQRNRLTPEEGFVLVAVTLASIGNAVAENIYADLFNCYGGMQASHAVRLLGAVEPSEWLTHRRMFLPDAPLMKNGLLKYERVPQGPEDVLDVTVSAGKESFALITGGQQEPESYEDTDGYAASVQQILDSPLEEDE